MFDGSDSSPTRSPLKALFSSATKNINRNQWSVDLNGTAYDLIQAKVDYLEKERLDLTMQLHNRDEKERSKIKMLEQARESMMQSLEETRTEVDTLTEQNITLKAEIKKLKIDLECSASSSNSDAWNKMTASSRELRRVEDENASLKRQLEESKHVFEDQVKSVQDSVRAFEANNEELNERNKKARVEVILKAEELRLLQSDYQGALAVNKRLVEEHEELALAMLNRDEVISRMKIEHEATLKSFEARMAAMSDSAGALTLDSSSCCQVVDLLEEHMKKIAELNEMLSVSENNRKQLHNKLQELKGNIRVFVRCRPLLSSDRTGSGGSGETGVVCHKDGTSLSVTAVAKSTPQSFVFDQVLAPEISQAGIYGEVADFVQSALDGYRVCIFSYGQTGSGKTHTMTGQRHGNERGIIPRAVEHILRQTTALQKIGWTIAITVSMVELYNEELRDLLSVSSSSDSSGDSSHSNSRLKIHYHNGRVSVSGLTSHEIDSTDVARGTRQVEEALDVSSKNRTTASTAMNSQSSRSHAIFMLELEGKHGDGVTFMRGGLRLCDLAGSERLERSGTLNDAARLKETVNINKSLSCLADVFLALSNKQSHIPYRNSKLTMLLQDCLSGDGKSLMIVNISPTIESGQETLCSLRFASQVSKVELGKAQRNVFVAQASIAAPAPSGPSTQSSRSAYMSHSSHHAAPPPPPPPLPAAACTSHASSRAAPFVSDAQHACLTSSCGLPAPKKPITQATLTRVADPESVVPFSKRGEEEVEEEEERQCEEVQHDNETGAASVPAKTAQISTWSERIERLTRGTVCSGNNTVGSRLGPGFLSGPVRIGAPHSTATGSTIADSTGADTATTMGVAANAVPGATRSGQLQAMRSRYKRQSTFVQSPPPTAMKKSRKL